MKRPILLLTKFLSFCCSIAAISISAQSLPESTGQISSKVKIESFDWYATSDVPGSPKIRNYYRRGGLPEGESANFPPAENSSRAKEPEKFIYRIRIRNLSDKEIASIVWRYEFFNPLTKELAASLEFESRVRVKPRRRKTLYGESFSPPAQTIDISLLLLNKKQPFLESINVKSVTFKESAKKNTN
jgi:hypothetical protein